MERKTILSRIENALSQNGDINIETIDDSKLLLRDLNGNSFCVKIERVFSKEERLRDLEARFWE